MVFGKKESNGKLEALSLENPGTNIKSAFRLLAGMGSEADLLGVIHPEEVRIQNGLYDTCHDGDGIEMALGKVPIDPVGDVQGPVDAQREQIVRCDGLCLASPLQHEQLRQDRHTFQPDGECPQHFRNGPLVWEDDSEDGGGARQVGDAEGVEVRIEGGLVVVQHHVKSIGGRAEEDDLENCVPRAVGEGPEEICDGRGQKGHFLLRKRAILDRQHEPR